jgi:hypothetical protein
LADQTIKPRTLLVRAAVSATAAEKEKEPYPQKLSPLKGSARIDCEEDWKVYSHRLHTVVME